MNPLDSARPWLVPLRPPGPDTIPLVCFPHAGGSANYFFPWAEPLAPRVAVVGVQYPGRYERRHEPVPHDLAVVAAEVADAVGPVVERGPCLFLGHSMGAVIAYEVCRLLARHDLGPARLIVSGRRSPTRHRDETVHHRDDEGLVEEVRKLGGQSTAILDDPDIRAMFLPIIRGDFALVEEYRHVPGPPLTCPLTILTGEDDLRVTEDEARAWAPLTSGATEMFVRPGGHFFLDGDRTFVVDLIARHAALLPSTVSG